MTTTSSFVSMLTAAATSVPRSWLVSVLLIVTSGVSVQTKSGSCRALQRRLLGELRQAFAEHPIEGGERVNDVGERLQRRGQLDRQHELAQNLAGARRHERCADQHAALAVANQFERAAVKVMDVAARGLRRIRAGDNDVEA